jgi:hypothetical protein
MRSALATVGEPLLGRVVGDPLVQAILMRVTTQAVDPQLSPGAPRWDRGKQGLKRSVATEARGVPLGIVSAGANRRDSPLFLSTLEATKEQAGELPDHVDVNLDRGYDSDKARTTLAGLGFTAEIARKGVPAPVQAGKRWVVERSRAWMNGFGKLRRCTEKRIRVVDCYLYLAAAIFTLRMLIRRAPPLYRWDGRPTTKPLK